MSTDSLGMTFVLDTEAALSLPSLMPSARIGTCFESLSEHVEAGNLTFPDIVPRECKRIAEDENVTVWLRAVSGSRRFKSFGHRHQQNVLAVCEDLLDLDDEREQSPVAVAAMGDFLAHGGHDFIIVTEDRRPQPTRICLFDACSALGFKATDTRTFLRELALIA